MKESLYLQPETLEELSEALSKMTEKSCILGGGTDILPEIRSNHPEIDIFISLCQLKEMCGITEEEGCLRIGAMTTHIEITKNPLVQKYFKALSMACGSVGSLQIRNKGTIGGSLGNASPAGDMIPCVDLFHGEIEVINQKKETRRIKGIDFILGVGRTGLREKEAILAICLPIKEKQESCFVKLGTRREVSIAQISLALSWERNKEGLPININAYLGAVDTKPIHVLEAKEILGNKGITDKDKDELSEKLSEKIRIIRENRKRQPKLRILDSEKIYKERAIRSVVYDAVEYML